MLFNLNKNIRDVNIQFIHFNEFIIKINASMVNKYYSNIIKK